MIVPALLVLITTLLVLRKSRAAGTGQPGELLSLQLRACERLVLLVERISPSNLLLRNHEPGLSPAEFNARLIADVRAEFDHNITQQLYVSERSWQMVRSLKDKTISMINGIAGKLPEGATGLDLTKAVLNHVSSLEQDPYQETLGQLRQEVKAFV